ncbi:MAG: methyltransferase domain-containing protein [Candidatus Electrothrix sp. AR4]|nr:methyltransferase domain-containing protein [Candidatus Electrothrix sp. AR4]
MRLLNIGCGKRFHKDWINIDKIPSHPSVKQCDAEQGLPFPDSHFDVVYHSHILEHFELQDAKHFIKECYRVLKAKGVLRVAVPDLEQIVLCYLQTLQEISHGNIRAQDDYNWIMLELYDQVVRNSSGGQMVTFLNRASIPNRDFIVKRCGVVMENLMQHFKKSNSDQPEQIPKKISRFSSYFLNPRSRIEKLREQLLKILLGKEYRALKIGRFRSSGENHQWMYDRFSLHNLLDEFGFVDILQRHALQSYIPNWSAFHLDTEHDGRIYKPDSLYMEAVKPGSTLSS